MLAFALAIVACRRELERLKYEFNGLRFNIDHAKTVTSVYELIIFPSCLLYLALVFPSEFVVLIS